MIVHEHFGVLEVHEDSGAVVLEVPSSESHTVYIAPPVNTATYDLRILNSKGFEIYKLKGRMGKTKRRVDLLLVTNCTIELSNVSHPGNYTYYLSLKS